MLKIIAAPCEILKKMWSASAIFGSILKTMPRMVATTEKEGLVCECVG